MSIWEIHYNNRDNSIIDIDCNREDEFVQIFDTNTCPMVGCSRCVMRQFCSNNVFTFAGITHYEKLNKYNIGDVVFRKDHDLSIAKTIIKICHNSGGVYYQVEWDNINNTYYEYSLELVYPANSRKEPKINFKIDHSCPNKKELRDKFVQLNDVLRTKPTTRAVFKFINVNNMKEYWDNIIKNYRKEIRKSQQGIRYLTAERKIKGHIVKVREQFDDNKKFKSTKITLKSKLKYEIQQHRKSLRNNLKQETIRGVNFFRNGKVMSSPGTILNIFQLGKGNVLNSPKIPLTKERHIGIEIEFVHRDNVHVIIDKILEHKNLWKYVQLKHDRSVNGSGSREHGHELILITSEKSRYERIKEVADFLHSIDADVNTTCGLHVHLDMRNRNVKKSFHNLVSSQDILMNTQPASRHNNSYCETNTTTDFVREQNNDQRYKVINATAYNKFNTLEVRCHSGTIDYSKIINWVDFLIKITDSKQLVKKPKNLEELQGMVEFNNSEIEYIAERIELFSPLSPHSSERNNIIQSRESMEEMIDDSNEEYMTEDVVSPARRFRVGDRVIYEGGRWVILRVEYNGNVIIRSPDRHDVYCHPNELQFVGRPEEVRLGQSTRGYTAIQARDIEATRTVPYQMETTANPPMEEGFVDTETTQELSRFTLQSLNPFR